MVLFSPLTRGTPFRKQGRAEGARAGGREGAWPLGVGAGAPWACPRRVFADSSPYLASPLSKGYLTGRLSLASRVSMETSQVTPGTT